MENIPSICIPSIEKTITSRKIRKVFEKLGDVNKIKINKNKK